MDPGNWQIDSEAILGFTSDQMNKMADPKFSGHCALRSDQAENSAQVSLIIVESPCMVIVMAITATLVHSGHNRLRYLLSTLSTGADTGVITTTGAATPDILTDLGTNQGPVMLLAKAFTQGYGKYAPGALTQAKSRALWLSDRIGSQNPSTEDAALAGLDIVPTALCRLTPRTGISDAWFVDANVDGPGHPTINVASVAVSDGDTSATCELDIYVGDTIGD